MLQTAHPSPRPRSLASRAPFILVVLAVAAALATAIVGPAAVGGKTAPPPSTVVAERTLGFHDRADGAVTVTEAGKQVAVFEGEQGFIRGILRSMARQRRGEGLTSAEPFRLTAWADGRMTLDDPATGERIELEAFGPTNAAVFASLLPIRQPKLPDYYK